MKISHQKKKKSAKLGEINHIHEYSAKYNVGIHQEFTISTIFQHREHFPNSYNDFFIQNYNKGGIHR